ncbi:MAG: hypothetical protein LBK68_00250 [Candidatus Margulisbacteria bacterium]|nr:hypothetical protein [Candidatus Margulisiibacteriota bacterium]
MQSIETTAQVRRLIVDSINKSMHSVPVDSLSGSAKHIDYEISALLPAIDNKSDFCRQILTELNAYAKHSPEEPAKAFLAKLKIYLLGKLFYLHLQNKRYLLIQDFSSRDNHKFVLDAVSQIETSAENAAFFLDSLAEQKQKDFFIGIISYIYN